MKDTESPHTSLEGFVTYGSTSCCGLLVLGMFSTAGRVLRIEREGLSIWKKNTGNKEPLTLDIVG